MKLDKFIARYSTDEVEGHLSMIPEQKWYTESPDYTVVVLNTLLPVAR